MGKLKRIRSWFSSGKPAAAPKQQVAQTAAEQTAKEQKALALINQGKFQEAEAIYKGLVAA